MADVEDAYAYYVCVLGVSEGLFWHADIHSVRYAAESKQAFDAWLGRAQARELKKEVGNGDG